MNTKLYVGGLSSEMNSLSLRAEFEKYGVVTDVHIPIDRQTGRFRGFAFVTMSTEEECRLAMEKLHGAQLGGRAISVTEARAPGERDTSRPHSQTRNDDAAEFYARANRRGR
jgi:RNA recognition motif-containing protein